ncbi:MAG TPA: hypothetical protein PKM84_00880 [Candidatus Pacearchaeota archaeon]|nr:hypothetical protein [Candidatus Pacearchaeota archaeon]
MQSNGIFDLKVTQNRRSVADSLKDKAFKPRQRQPENKGIGIFLTISLLAIIGLAGAYYLIEPSTEIVIYPKKNNFEKIVDLKSSKSKYDFSENDYFLPIKEYRENLEYRKEYPASETQLSEKSSGTIRFFNETSIAQTFVTNTQFIQGDGKVFLAAQSVTVPPMNGKEPGYADVKVIASSSGKDYNIGPANFSLPKLKKTELYTKFYGKSSGPMTGGFEGIGKAVNPEDVVKAKEDAENGAKKFADEKIESLKESNIIFEDTIYKNIATSAPAVALGQRMENFDYAVYTDIRALMLEKSLVDDLAKQIVSSSVSSDYLIDWKTYNYKILSASSDTDRGKGYLKIKIIAQSTFAMDQKKIVKSLSGKYINEINEILKGVYPDKIDQVDIKVWPWGKQKTALDPVKTKVLIEGID